MDEGEARPQGESHRYVRWMLAETDSLEAGWGAGKLSFQSSSTLLLANVSWTDEAYVDGLVDDETHA